MNTATVTKEYEISGLQRLQGRVFETTSPPGWWYRERGGKEAKLMQALVKQRGSAHQAPCLIAVLDAIWKYLQQKAPFHSSNHVYTISICFLTFTYLYAYVCTHCIYTCTRIYIFPLYVFSLLALPARIVFAHIPVS